VVTEPAWRKSRRSANNANCVELGGTLDQVRDSKNATGPVLRADVAALLRAIQAGYLDR
jgi:hypothetical protein